MNKEKSIDFVCMNMRNFLIGYQDMEENVYSSIAASIKLQNEKFAFSIFITAAISIQILFLHS